MKISDIPYLQQILHKTEALKELLESEFSALSKRTCQNLKKSNKKSEILASLSNEKFLSLVEFQKTNSDRIKPRRRASKNMGPNHCGNAEQPKAASKK